MSTFPTAASLAQDACNNSLAPFELILLFATSTLSRDTVDSRNNTYEKAFKISNIDLTEEKASLPNRITM